MEPNIFIKQNWQKKTIIEIVEILDISVEVLLEEALKMNLQKISSENEARRWTKDEDEFLSRHSKTLTVRDASNLLHRSHYATYQRVKYLGLEEMINKKNRVNNNDSI